MKKFSCTIVLLVFLASEVFPQGKDKPSFRFIFYNVENFFDTYDDTLKEDDDFLPHGLMRWNFTRYYNKVNSLYKVISAAGEWDPPIIAGFCEVENKSVLRDLITKTYLQKYNYEIIHEESNDQRGIDVCLIYRKDISKLVYYQYIKPDGFPDEKFKTRSILYSKWLIESDTIHLFLNHWPSRRGGVLAGESLRISIAEMLKEKIDSISVKEFGTAKIVVAGDFNSTTGDPEVAALYGSYVRENVPLLVNLSEPAADNGLGTYRYLGSWEMIDQVFVSDWFMKCSSGFYTDFSLFRVFNPGFLLRRDPAYPGFIPYSTYRGYKYQGGYSDHLPVILDIKRR